MCNCDNTRMVSISAKCSDLFSASMNDKEHDGYVPYNLGIGGGDYVNFDYCLNCGKIKGEWPLPLTKTETIKQSTVRSILKPQVQAVIDHVEQTDGIKMRETFDLLTELTLIEDVAATLNELIRIDYRLMANQFLQWLEEWDQYEDLRMMIKYPDDEDDDDDSF